MRHPFASFALPCLVLSLSASAELRPDKVHVADSRKNLSYVRDGLVIGGDKAIDSVVVKGIRRAPNTGFERVVIDLEGSKGGEPAAIERPPYYQLSVTPDERRLVLTLWGKPKLDFDSRKVAAAFKNSSVVQAVQLLPRLDEENWTLVFELKGESPVEVFELANPVRVILDIKGGAPKVLATHPSPKAPARGKPQARAKPAKKAAPATRRAPRKAAPVEHPAPEDDIDAPEGPEDHG